MRDAFDDSLCRIKRQEFDALWVDFADARQFAGVERTSQVCSRLSSVITCADRHSVPVFLAASRRNGWRHPAVEDLIKQRHYHVSHHSWCRASACLSPGLRSSVKHKILSTLALPNHDCLCTPGTEHVFDLDQPKVPGYAKARADAEAKAVSMIVTALNQALEARQGSESAKLPDPVCNELAFMCRDCGVQQQTNTCMLCEGPCIVAAISSQNPSSVNVSDVNVSLHSDVGSIQQPSSRGSDPPPMRLQEASSADVPAEPPQQQASFPTDQKIQQKLKLQEMQAKGELSTARRKPKKVEQRFDDCGEDLSSLGAVPCEYLCEPSSASEDDDAVAEILLQVEPVLNAAVHWSFLGSSCPDPPDLHSQSTIAADLEEMFMILDDPVHQNWGIEIVEFCGGQGLTTYLCVKRRLRGGQCFDLTTGVDLTDPVIQRKVLGYLDVARPLIVVMAPVCTPYGPLGNRNRVLHPEAWRKSLQNAEPLAAFCGRVAQLQLAKGRYFLTEQPYPSRLYLVAPWPEVRSHPRCFCVVFHQCMVQQSIDGLPVKKPTELVSNALPILQNFANLQCDGSHDHASLLGGRADAAKKWTYDMCSRIANGIEKLVRQLAREGSLRLASSRQRQPLSTFPSVAIGTGDSGEVEVSEAWRKCKGCLWRLHKYDSLHSRKRGECKYPDVRPGDFQCPGCLAHKPRADPAHKYDETCRHGLTSARSSKQRRPMGRVAARSEPTAELRASDLGQQAEQDAEQANAPRAPPDLAASPGDALPEEVAGGSGDPILRVGHGPDREPRERRTWVEGETQTPIPSDWSSFDVQASLRGLRFGNEASRRQILRKLHIRWWHASTDKMTRILKAANLPKEVLDLVPAIQDTCRVCRHWARPQPDAKASCRMVVGFNIEVEGDLMFYRHNGQPQILLVLADRGVRWIATTLIPDR